MSKTSKLVSALIDGAELSAAQISARFGIANPSATVDYLRQNTGLAIYCNETRTGVNKYRLGTPARSVVAAGYRALAQGLV